MMPDHKKLIFSTLDKNDNSKFTNLTYFITLVQNDDVLIRDYFFVKNESFTLELIPNNSDDIEIIGERQYDHNAIITSNNLSTKVYGKLFNSNDPYELFIDIRTLDDTSDWIFSLNKFFVEINSTDVSLSKLKDSIIREDDDFIPLVNDFVSNEYVSPTYSTDDLLSNNMEQNASLWINNQITDDKFLQTIPADKMFSSNYYPDWLVNNAGWWSARILTNSEFTNFNYDYVEKSIFPCNVEYSQEPNTSCISQNINSDGLRGQEIDMLKNDDSFRIFAVGGSTTFGAASNESKTWPSFLQQLIDEKITQSKNRCN